jgi:hypothetical protein
MVGHDDSGVKIQAVSVESSQTCTHRFANIGSSQCATAVAGIERLLHAFAKKVVVVALLFEGPRLWISFEPGVSFRAKLTQFGLRQRVSDAECHPVDRALTAPMRKIAPADVRE